MNRSSTPDESLKDFLSARNKALIEMDFNYLRSRVTKPMTDEMCELVMHKSRYDCTAIPAELRHASGNWLREKGYNRMTGTPLLPEGELPE